MTKIKKVTRKGPQPKAYAYKGKVYCADHLPVKPDANDVTPIDKIDAWKAYPQCHQCGKFFTGVKLHKG